MQINKKVINNQIKIIKMVQCLECDFNIIIPKDSLEGEIVTCQDCGSSFEIMKVTDGFKLKPAQTVGEDWGQ